MAAETALKFVLVGDSNVGKSQLSFRFCKEKFNVSSQSTVGIEFATRTISIHDYSVKAQLWDTAGQERFESMTRAYFRNAVGAILVYDVTKRQSFENLKNKWISELQEFGHHDMYIIIIGNKADLDSSQHAVRSGEAADFAGTNSCCITTIVDLSQHSHCMTCALFGCHICAQSLLAWTSLKPPLRVV